MYYWRVDEVNEADPNSPWKGDVWSFVVPSKQAYNPVPADGVGFLDTDVSLSWTPGFGAALHSIYFDDNFDDVSNAAGALPQSEAVFTPTNLEIEKTYYWRVDEFDGITTHKGDVWSFSTMPVIPKPDDPNLVGWWKLDEGKGTTAVDYSGHGRHGTLQDGGMLRWVDGYDGGALQFGGSYVNLDDYKGVNAVDDVQQPFTIACWIKTNGDGEMVTWGTAAGGQRVSFRVDVGSLRTEHGSGNLRGNTTVNDNEWHHVALVVTEGAALQVPQTQLYLDGQADSTFSGSGNTYNLTAGADVCIGCRADNKTRFFPGSIDDVRIYSKALTQEEIVLVMRGDRLLAWSPNPANASTPDIDNALPLMWSPGDKVSQHEVYFGTDRDGVKNADASDTTGIHRGSQAGTSFTPAEGVQWDSGPFYWRIDENNTDATVTRGRIWSFTVADFILVDDFESYTDNDAEGEAIWQHWIDGFDSPANGSQVGNLVPPYIERTIVNSGSQSMPLSYDNTAGVSDSRGELTLTAPRDWTGHGVVVLSLWFRGYPESVGSFTEGPIGTFTITAAGADITGTADQFHFFYKTLTGPGTIVARVDSITNTDLWAKAGVMIRETLDPGSKHALVAVTPEQGVASEGRTDADSTSFSMNETGITAPHWVKLERDVAGNFTASHSTNGLSWQSVAGSIPTNIPMDGTVYVGLALTSHDVALTCEAKFSNVTVSGTAGPQWAHQDIGILANDAQPLHVALSSSNGASATVVNDDPAAATTDAWTEWRIDLQVFADQDVNLADVDKIAIGLGGQGTAGGSGTVFIDDIRLHR